MKHTLFLKGLKIIIAALIILLIIPVLNLKIRTAQAAEPADASAGSAGGPAPTFTGQGQPKGKLGGPHSASRHILVQLHPRADQRQFLQDAKARGLNRLGRVFGSRWMTMSIPTGAEPRQAAAAARMLPGVLQATPDPIVRINDQIPPRDPLYIDDDDPSTKPCDPLIEVCNSEDMVDQWGLFKVEAEGGWVVQSGTADVVIAILDSGMDLDHDDLFGNIWTNPGEIPDNNVDDDGNGFVDDVHGADFCGDNVGSPTDDPASQDANPDIPMGGRWVEDPAALPFGIRFAGDPAVGDAIDNNLDQWVDPGVSHGTMVGGVAGAMTDNINPDTMEYEGMAGASWHCKLMPVRLINAEGWAYGSDAAAAVYYAVNMGADVINISWGMEVNTADPAAMEEIQVLVQAIDYAASQGVIVVAAAGNSGTANLHFPASMRNTIAVGSSNWLDRRSDFSCFAASDEIPDNGVDDDGNGWVDDTLDVLAPGELIWSTAVLSAYDGLLYDFMGMLGWEPGSDTYGQVNGTSFSTPLVSGYVGLILSQNPGATLNQVRSAIRSNAEDVLDPNGTGDWMEGYDAYSGFGRMRMVVPTLSPEPNQNPIADAGADQAVSDTRKPGIETVTLDGSMSHDPDGFIASYRWFQDNEPIAAGQTATVNLPVGAHTITLRVTDDQSASSEDEVIIQIKGKNDGTPDSGERRSMGVYAADWTANNHINVTINIRCDSNGNEGLDDGDDGVSGARVTFLLKHDTNDDEVFNCAVDDCWTFEGRTDDSGNFRSKLPRAPVGSFQGEVTGLTHDIHLWDKNLDLENPDTFTR